MSPSLTLRKVLVVAILLLPAAPVTQATAAEEGWGPGHELMWGGPVRNWFGWGAADRYCGDAGARNIDRFSTLVERMVKINDTQKPGLESVRLAFHTALAQLQPLCEKPHTGRWSPLERLTVAETNMNAMIAAIHTVRGPIESFYGQLDDKQKKTLDEISPDWRTRMSWGK